MKRSRRKRKNGKDREQKDWNDYDGTGLFCWSRTHKSDAIIDIWRLFALIINLVRALSCANTFVHLSSLKGKSCAVV